MAKIINQKAGKLGKKASIHIKIDTGMSRLGFLTDDNSINDILKLKEDRKSTRLNSSHYRISRMPSSA